MYKANLSDLDNLFENFFTNDVSKWKTTSTSYKTLSDYDVKLLEDGKQQLTISVVGHDVKNIKIDATDDKITIKAKKEEGSSDLIQNIDLAFSISKDYDGTKVEAKFSNGLLILTIDKKEERKAKSVQIKVG